MDFIDKVKERALEPSTIGGLVLAVQGARELDGTDGIFAAVQNGEWMQAAVYLAFAFGLVAMPDKFRLGRKPR